MLTQSWPSFRNSLTGWPSIDPLDDLLCEISQRLHPVAVILFGSLAKGTWRTSSDADLLVIVDRDEVPVFESSRLASSLHTSVPSDVFIYGKRQIEEMLRRLNFLAIEALHSGILVQQGDPGFISALQALFDRVIETVGVRRTESGWRYDPLKLKQLPIAAGDYQPAELLGQLDLLSDDAFFDCSDPRARHRRYEGWNAARFATALSREIGGTLCLTIPQDDPPDCVLWRPEAPQRRLALEIREVFAEGRRRDDELRLRADIERRLIAAITEEEKVQVLSSAITPGLWSATNPILKRMGAERWNLRAQGAEWVMEAVRSKVTRPERYRSIPHLALLLCPAFDEAHELGAGGAHEDVWSPLRAKLDAMLSGVFESAWLLTTRLGQDAASVPHFLHLAGTGPLPL